MRFVRFHPAPPSPPGANGDGGGEPSAPSHHAGADLGNAEACGGRLNLLLSCAHWREDSWADRLPRLLEPMGIASHRASTAREAERTIRSTPVHIAVVDLGLPLDANGDAETEPAGARLLQLLSRLEQPPPTVVIKGYAPCRQEVRLLNTALRHDAFAVMDRAAADIESMLRVLQRALVRFYAGRWPGGAHNGGGATT